MKVIILSKNIEGRYLTVQEVTYNAKNDAHPFWLNIGPGFHEVFSKVAPYNEIACIMLGIKWEP